MTAAQINTYLSRFDKWDRYDYDGDGNFNEPDGYIDHFQSIHAGEGEETGGGAQGTNAIWSHRSQTNVAQFGVVGPPFNKFGGVRIGNSDYWVFDYTIEPENGGVGVFSHEFGHDLGLPDEYDTSGNTGGAENSTGFWTIMSSGSYGNDGTQDIGFTPDRLQRVGQAAARLARTTKSTPYGAKSEHKLGPAYYNTKQAAGSHRPASCLAEHHGPQPRHPALGLRERVVQRLGQQPGQYDDPRHHASRGLDHAEHEGVVRDRDVLGLRVRPRLDGRRYDVDERPHAPSPTRAMRTVRTSEKASTGSRARQGLRCRLGQPGLGSRHRRPVGLCRQDGEAPVPVQDRRRGRRTRVRVRRPGHHGRGRRPRPSPTTPRTAPTDVTLAGFRTTTGADKTEHASTTYIAENREYVGYDDGLRTGPLQLRVQLSTIRLLQNWAERLPYQDGMLVWYWNTRYSDNNVGDHPGSGRDPPGRCHRRLSCTSPTMDR